ncbi:hypothetical protein E1091_10595 [Micromonospora fluostatini]|uniref:GNAT family N-acetyltransferase n=1 Tax=Micromonospora fluostatini TaxID=1629071 RepID=A0ABY2DGM8_9ACTN|nr:hypothetical protein E1091_10595 [Micromonospora fluostatini]
MPQQFVDLATYTDPATRGRARRLLAQALTVDRTVRWIANDPGAVAGLAGELARVHLSQLLRLGRVWILTDGPEVTGLLAGIHPLDERKPGAIADYEEAVARATGQYVNRYVIQSRRHGDTKERLPAHFHLTHLAIEEPGRGLTAALLERLHQQLDPLGVPCYTTALGSASLTTAHRLGYEAHGHPEGEPRIIGLWRSAPEFTPNGRA